MFADLIFPVFTTPYFLVFGVFPWAIVLALVSEIVVYRIMVKGRSLTDLSVLTAGANVFSWIIGVIIAALLPDNFVGREIDASQQVHFPAYAVLGAFGIAWGLSVILEGGVWKGTLWKQRDLPLWKATLVANTVSYALLLGLLFLTNHFSFEVKVE